MKTEFLVTLRDSLSPTAKVLHCIGTKKSYIDAYDAADKFILDPANRNLLGIKKSYYQCCTEFSKKDPTIIGIDYGSHSRFIFIHEI